MFDDKKMTIYYRKRTGTIEGMCTCVNDMNWYGDLKEDYELTHDYIVLDLDEYVINNLANFKVVNENGEKRLKLKNDEALNKYR